MVDFDPRPRPTVVFAVEEIEITVAGRAARAVDFAVGRLVMVDFGPDLRRAAVSEVKGHAMTVAASVVEVRRAAMVAAVAGAEVAATVSATGFPRCRRAEIQEITIFPHMARWSICLLRASFSLAQNECTRSHLASPQVSAILR